MEKTNNTISYRTVWTMTLAALGVVYLLWNVAALDFLVYPLRLFVTYIHEAGHSLMALLTGGRVIGFSVSPDGSGLATTAGGSRALILPAGYLGAAFFGAALFYLVNTLRRPRFLAIIIGVGMVVFTLMYASLDASGAPVAFIVGILGGAALIGMGWKLNRTINMLVLNVLAIMTGLNAILDLWLIVRFSNLRSSDGLVRNDALAFSEEITPLIPPVVIALIWALIAVLMLGAAVYYALLRPALKAQDAEHKPRREF